jgi:hypothetical protein
LTWLLYLLFSTVTSRFSFREGGFMCFTIRYVHKVWSPLFWHKMIMLIYSYINWNVIVLNVLWSCVELIDYVWIQILISRIQRLSLSLSLTHTHAHTNTLCDVTVVLKSFIWWWTIKHTFWEIRWLCVCMQKYIHKHTHLLAIKPYTSNRKYRD